MAQEIAVRSRQAKGFVARVVHVGTKKFQSLHTLSIDKSRKTANLITLWQSKQ
jgi:hypothetical protein